MGATTMMVVSTGMSLLGGLQQAQGQRAAGEAAAQSGAYNRQMAINSAIIARRQAGRIGESGREQVSDIAEEGRFLSGRALTAMAANGVVVGDGSALDLTEDIAGRTRRNIERTRQGTVDRQAGQIAQAGDLEQQGYLAEVGGANAQAAGEIQSRTTLLNTGAQVAGNWYTFAKLGGLS